MSRFADCEPHGKFHTYISIAGAAGLQVALSLTRQGVSFRIIGKE